MNISWLKPIWNALEQLENPVTVFYRNDDAGWATPELMALVDLFDDLCLPLDIAVIPHALTDDLEKKLLARLRRNGLVAIHQHGFQHLNHQQSGKKCEFGDHRNRDQQYHDIAQGKEIMLSRFGEQTDPIFTPPWNRCNPDTIEILEELRFSAVSCDDTADLHIGETLTGIPVHIDWLKKTNGERWEREKIMQKMAKKLIAGGTIGVMLHHQPMDNEERQAFSQFAQLLLQHPQIVHKNMRAFI
ncbi:MAG: DUF2334 domain-containing protein [Nitrosomonas sp.]|nr:DUF2334 domain-containing protein [Nitrosomonas sp.]